MHKPVLLAEVIANLNIKDKGIYVDATFGRGGHSREILKLLGPNGQLLVLDKDPQAIQEAKLIEDKRVKVHHGSFKNLKKWIAELGLLGKIDGILLDLGVSSPQLDEPQRGFSFMQDGPLDMRMDPSQSYDAAAWINTASEKEIDNVLQEYGEEKFHRRIAAAIVRAREIAPIKRTLQLAAIIAKANPKWERHKHPATRSFQAIRIFIYHELEELKNCLEQSLEILTVKGRLLIITFHSLEMRIVKQFLHKYAKADFLPRDIPIKYQELKIRLQKIKGTIRPNKDEIVINPRARSAALTVMEKIS